jgi:AcrR family transcriptional regulator
MVTKIGQRAKRQQVIVDAARRLFACNGIEQTSMDDIAAAANYTRRTLYAYFKSRDEICLRVLTDDMAVRWATQKEAMKPAETGLAKIIAWAESFFVFAKENPASMHLHLYWDLKGMDRDKFSDETFEMFESINDDLADGLRKIFRLGVRDGSLRADLKIDLCISQYLYTMRAALHRAISSGYSFAQFDSEEYFQYYLDLFTRAIRNDKRNQS